MKRALIIMMTAASIFAGCYDDNNRAIVRIGIGNIPYAHIVPEKSLIDRILCFFAREAYAYPSGLYLNKLHLVALQNNSPTAIHTVNIADLTAESATDYVEFEVPAGKKITIAVLGEVKYAAQENIINEIQYYGKSSAELDLIIGEITSIQISMQSLNESLMEFTFPGGNLNWTALPGATGYRLYDGAGGLIADTEDNFYNGADYSYMFIDFDYINKSSSQITITLP